MRDVLTVKGKRAEFTHVFATVSKTASASGGNFVAAHRALVASDIDDFDDVRIIGISSHSEFDAFAENGAFLIHAATHSRHFAGNDTLWYIDSVFIERTRLRLSCDFAQNFVFEMLNFSIENSHFSPFAPLRFANYTPKRAVNN